ncbi:PEP-CTERM sorting domain-containing protein [Nitrococcus mobilis]|uniref:Ice-binding protein C-terminal domain-containing protein n=1 Tax=Nitrococcus mobilis Nb-231 TaxID=314278 RepID=A4BTG5_9GAMM|nr:PEP-CTERM sorting domain-containing protein [Nitrococcus mobilis]EAR21067.1 hypothetical protein NB231_07852 [Nitrococcus mobilis Nb-231]
MELGKTLGALFVSGLLTFASAASANIVTVNFTGNGGLQAGDSMNFSSGGVNVTATAGAFALNGEHSISSRIGQYSRGLGNTTNYAYDWERCFIRCINGTRTVSDRSHEVDDHYEQSGHGVREFIKLDLGGLMASLIGIQFGYHGSNDDSATAISISPMNIIYSGGESSVEADDFTPHLASVFWIGAYDPNNNNNDWKLKNATFQIEDPRPPSSVPLPATWALFGAGVAGLGLMRRKRAHARRAKD